MFRYLSFWKKLSRLRKNQIYIIISLMIVVSLAEVLAVASIVPFLSSLTNSEININELSFLKYLPIDLNSEKEFFFYATIVVVSTTILSGLLKLQLLYIQTKFGQDLGGDISVRIYNNLLNQKYEDQIQVNSSEKISTITVKAKVVIGGIIMPLLNILSSSLISFSIFFLLIVLSPFVTLTAACGTILIYVLVSLTVKKRLSKYSFDLSKGKDKVQKVIQEALGAVRDIIISGLQNKYTDQYNTEDRMLRLATTNVHVIKGSPKYIIETLAIILIVLITYVITITNPNSNFVPILGALGLGLLKVLPLIQSAYSGWVSLKSNEDIFNDVVKMFDIETKIFTNQKNTEFNKSILFSNVGFSYKNKNKKILNNINFKINKGDFVGISGETGSGKSTLLDLLLGLIDPTEGKIVIDKKLKLDECKNHWYNLISHVPQSIFLFDETLKKNITLEDDINKINTPLLETSLQISNMTNLINSLEKGLDTKIGEKGIFFSGGQRQRIGIARAIYQNKKVIMLDEATNSLDEATEDLIYKELNKLKSDELTIINISHKKDAFKYCNKVFKLDNGVLSIIEK